MIEDATQKHRVLIEELAQNTIYETIKWVEPRVYDGIRTTLGDYSIEIYERNSEFSESDYHVVIFDEWESEIDKFTDVDISRGGYAPTRNAESYYELMANTVRTAKRQMKGADKAVDAIIGKLKDMMPF
ncbi:hypothetical protein [Brevundimonas sp. 'scallop']|uniref:hypothetical protein n=1 Tax=Brevundimonas sp. 'scallop' TaxID=2562582 RepID=UPI0013E1AD77|nr:hypothetical protein [Brevundimonas sp. 'scallop']QIF80923.1 hypothetical protein E4341_04040 [Brevundimonas sp. 'scallop']